MYIPSYFRNDKREDIVRFIKENSFGTVVSKGEKYPFFTHLIFEVEEYDGGIKMVSHIARANLQWQDFEKNPYVTLIFMGPHCYVSSSWYSEPEVPTWNYVSAEVLGKVKIIEDKGRTIRHLKYIVDKYEKMTQTYLDLNNLPKEVTAQMKELMAFEVEVDSMVLKEKLSQNRQEKDYFNITERLKERPQFDSEAVAFEMLKKKCPFIK